MPAPVAVRACVCMPRPDTGQQAAETPPEPVSVHRLFPEPPLFTDGDRDHSRGASRGSIGCESPVPQPLIVVEMPDPSSDARHDETCQLSRAVSTDMHGGGEQMPGSSKRPEEALEWSPPEFSGWRMLLAAFKALPVVSPETMDIR